MSIFPPRWLSPLLAAALLSVCSAVSAAPRRELQTPAYDPLHPDKNAGPRSNAALATEYHHCSDCSEAIRPESLREHFFVAVRRPHRALLLICAACSPCLHLAFTSPSFCQVHPVAATASPARMAEGAWPKRHTEQVAEAKTPHAEQVRTFGRRSYYRPCRRSYYRPCRRLWVLY